VPRARPDFFLLLSLGDHRRAAVHRSFIQTLLVAPPVNLCSFTCRALLVCVELLAYARIDIR